MTITNKSTLSLPFRGDPSVLRPASKDFHCNEILVKEQEEIQDDDGDDDSDDDDDFISGEKIMLTCTLPETTETLTFSCLEPSCGVLLEEENAAKKEDEGMVDPFFFDEGYTLAGKTGFQVWPGSRLLVEALTFREDEKDCAKLKAWQQRLAEGAKVMELGSGVGVVGASLSAAGAQVLLTDLPTLAKHSTQPNLKRNSTTTTTTTTTTTKTTTKTTKMLDGRDNSSVCPDWLQPMNNAVPIHKGWAASTAVDWTIPLEEQISIDTMKALDVVIASDCVWLVAMMEPLFRTIECVFACNQQAKLLLSFQRRDPKNPSESKSAMFTTVDQIITEMQSRNWIVECLAWRPINQTDPKEVFLFEVSPNNN